MRRSETGYKIPFNRPCFQGKELAYIAEAIHRGQIAGNGTFTQRCQAQLSQELRGAKVILTTSCTDALEMAAILFDLAPGDEVIMPTFTFVSTANAFALRGARPVFVDIRPDTLNLDETRVARAVTSRTRAIVPVHYAGVGCEMEALTAIADTNDLWMVEDNAHGLFGRFAGRPLGTFGDLATLSFHETKNFTCGEGGALVVNAGEFADRAEIIRDKGTNRARFFRGEVDKYSWVDVGSSFLPSDILAAFLLAQLEARERIQKQRKEIWDYYAEHLRDWADGRGVALPTVPPQCEQAYHMFYLLMPSLAARQAMMEHLRGAGFWPYFIMRRCICRRWGSRAAARPGIAPWRRTWRTGSCDCRSTMISAKMIRRPSLQRSGAASLEGMAGKPPRRPVANARGASGVPRARGRASRVVGHGLAPNPSVPGDDAHLHEETGDVHA